MATAAHKHSASYHEITASQIEQLQVLLLEWFGQHQRTLPWRQPFEESGNLQQRAYEVWISEIMLQQTQVNTVISYYLRWMSQWPTLQDLAKASNEDVRSVWKGLGYYSRGTRILAAAKELAVSNLPDGPFPAEPERLLKLISGVGPYTAGAISSIAFNRPAPVVDGNVVRVVSRWTAMAGDPKAKASIDYYWRMAARFLDHNRPGDWNQALMDLGATVCTPVDPDCKRCPVKSICKAYMEESLHRGFKPDQEQALENIEECHLCATSAVTATTALLPRTASYYPTKAPKKEARRISSLFVVVESIFEDANSPCFLVTKRPEKGLLAGLWQFPEMDITDQHDLPDDDVFHAFLEDTFNIPEDRLNDLNTKCVHVDDFLHLFTHLKQQVRLSRVRWTAHERDLFQQFISDPKNANLNHSPVDWVTLDQFAALSTCKSSQKAMEYVQTQDVASPKTLSQKRQKTSTSESPSKNTLFTYFKKAAPPP